MLAESVGELIEDMGSDVGEQFVMKDAREELYTYNSIVNETMLE